VKDTAQKWLPAEVLKVEKHDKSGGGFALYVTYMNWGSKWDEWIDTLKDARRLRSLGEALPETKEERDKKEKEMEFRQALNSRYGVTIVEAAKDGNCLFRSFAHQIYGDMEMHPLVRNLCYNHMENNRSYFSSFFAQDFDQYIANQRKLGEWGDQYSISSLQEVFKKRVKIYTPQGTTDMDVSERIGMNQQDMKTVRLSFHGNNHYNSVLHPNDPLPLGDGGLSVDFSRYFEDNKKSSKTKSEDEAENNEEHSCDAAEREGNKSRPGTPQKLDAKRRREQRRRERMKTA